MNTARLINQLLEIEQALDHLDAASIRGMIFDAQESVLAIERQMIEMMTDYEGLRMLMEFSRNSAASPLAEADMPAKMLVN